MNHAHGKLGRDQVLATGRPEVDEARAEIRVAFGLGQAAHDRRTELGPSQRGLARRARPAGALDPAMDITVGDGETSVVRTPHAA